ncbi:MAG TPA: hypothetical protein VND96_13775 [Candidatus Micrarchaeaceae archaeon]|nr:hypothetical protein [Candidatus Micrarchaeaceae archaeon]
MAEHTRDPEYWAEHERTALARAMAIEVTRYRMEHRLLQRALARQPGMPQPAIARLDPGDVNPSIDTLLHLARELGIAIHFDITREGLGLSAQLALDSYNRSHGASPSDLILFVLRKGV